MILNRLADQFSLESTFSSEIFRNRCTLQSFFGHHFSLFRRYPAMEAIMSEQHKRELVSAGETTFSNMLTVNALVELRYHTEERRARALGSSGIRYPAKRNMRHYARVQPEGTTEFDFPRLDEDSANCFSGVPEKAKEQNLTEANNFSWAYRGAGRRSRLLWAESGRTKL
jgi:hypothetical protein